MRYDDQDRESKNVEDRRGQGGGGVFGNGGGIQIPIPMGGGGRGGFSLTTMLIIGAVIVTLAITVELNFSPPFWVHVILWVPLTAVAVIGSLRLAKGVLISLEYRNAAAEGRIKDR